MLKIDNAFDVSVRIVFKTEKKKKHDAYGYAILIF